MPFSFQPSIKVIKPYRSALAGKSVPIKGALVGGWYATQPPERLSGLQDADRLTGAQPAVSDAAARSGAVGLGLGIGPLKPTRQAEGLPPRVHRGVRGYADAAIWLLPGHGLRHFLCVI